MSVFLLCFFSFLTGCGSCSSFQAAIKTSALNWPLHRGTATAFPLSAFGLSAFFFTTLSGFIFPGDTSDFLLLLAIGTFCLTIVPLLFIRIPHREQYQALATTEERPASRRRDSNQLHRTTSWQSKYSATRAHEEPRKYHPFAPSV
jgi:Nodulin-like